MRKWNRSLLVVLFVLCFAVSAQALFGPGIDVVDQAYSCFKFKRRNYMNDKWNSKVGFLMAAIGIRIAKKS